MEQRLSMVTLAVDDLPATRHFLEAGLGWEPGELPGEDIVFYQAGGSILALYKRDALARELGRPVPAQALGSVTLAWNARSEEEVQFTFQRAVDAGAVVVKRPEKAFWGGYSSYVEIPGGHLLEIAYNPFWPIDKEGNISLSAPETA
ncbi:VOC family protein [Roseibium sp. RKSG952]|nr:VOC family protein [Roseibium sp. RKSG952]